MIIQFIDEHGRGINVTGAEALPPVGSIVWLREPLATLRYVVRQIETSVQALEAPACIVAYKVILAPAPL